MCRRALRRLAFRICMTFVMPLIRAQAGLAHAVRAQRRMDGWEAYFLPLTLPVTLACWVPLRLAAVVALWLAVSAAGGVDAGAID
jgi:hypothetical protein